MTLAETMNETESGWMKSDVFVFTWYLFVSYQTVFWIFNTIMLMIEIFDISWIDQYRIQKDKPKIRFQKEIVNLLIKETIIHQITVFLAGPILYYVFTYFGHVELYGERPSWYKIAGCQLLFMLSEDTIFFWTHYLLHTRWLYQHIHKKHHVYKQPTSVTAVLSDPIESIQTQTAMWFMPVFLCQNHIVTLSVWMALRAYQTFCAHAGYNFPYITTQYWLPEWMPGALAHDYHHQHGQWNYGSFFSFWDQIMGTHRTHPIQLKTRKIAN